MNALIVLSALLAAACAAPSYNYGYAGANHANHYNGVRQAYVNRLAEKLGAGTGTANKDGVPGTYVTNGLAAHGDVYGYGNGYGQGYGHGYGQGYGQGFGQGYVVYPDQYNALRQKYVNKQAEAVGAGTGTYKDNGVPGTFLDKNHYG